MVIVEWCHKYGIPHSVRSDSRGSFRSRSIEKLKEMRVEHTHTSLYNSEANDGCERAIRSVKHCLTRDGVRKMTQEVLDIITFGINNQAQDDAGSAAERFFGRAPRTFLPSSLERYVVHQQLIERRKQKHIQRFPGGRGGPAPLTTSLAKKFTFRIMSASVGTSSHQWEKDG